MIRINRPVAPPIDVFAKASVKAPAGGGKVTRAKNERDNAIAFFTNPANFRNNKKLTKKSFPFKVYKDRQLSKTLEDIFGPKCAYCESYFAHVTPKHVEHFRPKSAIANQDGVSLTPGYFWLAGEWTNLLAACVDCNCGRTFDVPGQPKPIKLGKQAQFPLANESGRVRDYTKSVATEEPLRLLLDPCVDEPEKHLTYDDKGLVHARLVEGQPSKMGETSIVVYALQRKWLVETRLKVLNEIKLHIELLRYVATDLANSISAGHPDAVLQPKRDQITKLKAFLASKVAKDAPYIGMIRDYVRQAKGAGEFKDLIKSGIDPTDVLAPT